MKILYIILTILLLFTGDILSVPWDTGYIEWEQPDATKFTARSWGDEFASWMESDNGYQIILGPDEYYYYAVLDQNGEFTYSENKVGIDEALSESYHLERSPQRLAEIEAEIEAFNEQLEQNYIDFMAEFDGPSTPPLRLAIVLIDFADILHNEDYFKSDFDTLFFSTGYYFTDPQFVTPLSPDVEWVYGSMRDYYRNQSINKFDIVGKIGSDRSIVNPPDPNNPSKPLWVYMPEDKSFYDSLDKYYVISLVKAEAENQLNIDLDQYNKTGFIYAGEAGSGGTKATGIQNIFTCYERYKGNSQVGTFAHIGIPAHEFAHTLGVGDEYGIALNDIRNWSLMSMGIYNGGDNEIENGKGSCPAPFSPATRIKFNWVIPDDLNPQENFIVQYNYSAPYFYKINVPYSSEYFVIERRQKEGYDLYTPKYENPNDPPKGILIWHIDESYSVQLEPANNIFP